MKILILSDCNNPHTIKLVKSFSKKNNIEVFLYGLERLKVNDYLTLKNFNVKTLDIKVKKSGTISKIKYLQAIFDIKKIIKEFRPDIVHAHYASSYGLLGVLSGFHPFVISVWGSDIYIFPKKTFIHKIILKYNLKKADKILSTSFAMAKETSKYTNKNIDVIPFGVDLDVFKSKKVLDSYYAPFNSEDIIIGTVKSLEKIYGVEYLIKAFKIVLDKHKNLPLKLLIVGGGSLKKSLISLTKELKIDDKVKFVGKIPYYDVCIYHNIIDISVFLSLSESFGVAVVEASACEKPVVVSNVGGLPEVVDNGLTGFVVPVKSEKKAAEAIEKLILNRDLRVKMGKNGRKKVKELYNWNNNFRDMNNVYIGLQNKVIDNE